MGNQQSNERKRIIWSRPKIKKDAILSYYKVVKKETYSSFIRFNLDNYVTYKDGDYKHIDFVNTYPCNEESMDICQIDSNYIRNYNHAKTFSVKEMWDAMGIVGWEYSESNIRGSSGNSLGELSECLGEIGETLEQRQNMIASIEQSRHAENHAWTKQTSWDMPPGWK